MSIKSWLKTKIISMKVYLGRATGYASMFSAGSILFLLLSKLHESNYISWNPEKAFIPIMIIGFISLVFIGWVEVKLKGVDRESEIYFELSPPHVEMRNNIREIKERLKFIENNKQRKDKEE